VLAKPPVGLLNRSDYRVEGALAGGAFAAGVFAFLSTTDLVEGSRPKVYPELVWMEFSCVLTGGLAGYLFKKHHR
jgi:hypothetical protein